MTLKKRYLRNIKENISFYLASTILTIVTLLLYFMFNIAGNAIVEFGDHFFATQQLEDAHFETYLPIPDADIKNLEEKYHLKLEAQHYINIENGDVTARVFERTKKVDLYQVTKGKDVTKDDEIVISEGYAVAQKIQIGDQMKIGDQKYTVCGFMQRPDYLYMLESEDDSYKNISTFYLCYMSDHAFQKLNASGVSYLVRYEKDTDTTAFRKAIHKKYYTRSYSAAAENPRITMVDEQAQMFIVMSYMLLVILPLVAVVLICIIISRKVKSEQRMIGTLAAMGYKKSSLMLHYAGFAALPGLFGGILTAVIAGIWAQPFSEMGLQDYEPMHIKGHLDVVPALLGILIPTILYVLAALLAVRKLLKKDTVLLLNGNADAGKVRMKRILVGKKMSFRKKFAIRSMLGNPARSLVILLGVFLGSFIMLLGLGFFDTIDHTGDTAGDELGSYQHEYILNELLDKNTYGGDTLLVSNLENKDGKATSVIGISDDNPYITLSDKNGKKCNVQDGYYITSLTEIAYGIHAGDTVDFYNPLSMEKKRIKIQGVVKNNVQKAIFTSKQKAAEISGLDAKTFNCIVSEKELDIPEKYIAQEIKKSDISDQVKTMTEQMDFMLYMIIGLGILICVVAVYISVNMMVTECRSNISMLKVLGYQDRQINKIVLNTNHILLPIGILLSIPAVYGACNLFYKWMIDYGTLLMETHIGIWSYLISIGLTVCCYFGSLWLLRHKVQKIDMIESLKDNRE